jgi:hypothetical protein
MHDAAYLAMVYWKRVRAQVKAVFLMFIFQAASVF